MILTEQQLADLTPPPTVAKIAGPSTPKSASLPGKPRTTPGSGSKTQARTQPNTPKSNSKAPSKAGSSGTATPNLSGAQQDLAGLHLEDEVDEAEKEREVERYKERPGLSMKQEELIAKVKIDEEDSGKQNISLIVVGEYDYQIEGIATHS